MYSIYKLNLFKGTSNTSEENRDFFHDFSLNIYCENDLRLVSHISLMETERE